MQELGDFLLAMAVYVKEYRLLAIINIPARADDEGVKKDGYMMDDW